MLYFPLHFTFNSTLYASHPTPYTFFYTFRYTPANTQLYTLP